MASTTFAAVSRQTALRFQSSDAIRQAVDRAAFELENLVDDGPGRLGADLQPIIRVRDQLDLLGGQIAGEYPSRARVVRLAAAELNRAVETDDPAIRFRRVSDALDALEALR